MAAGLSGGMRGRGRGGSKKRVSWTGILAWAGRVLPAETALLRGPSYTDGTVCHSLHVSQRAGTLASALVSDGERGHSGEGVGRGAKYVCSMQLQVCAGTGRQPEHHRLAAALTLAIARASDALEAPNCPAADSQLTRRRASKRPIRAASTQPRPATASPAPDDTTLGTGALDRRPHSRRGGCRTEEVWSWSCSDE